MKSLPSLEEGKAWAMEDFLLVDSDSDDGEKRSERMEDGLTEKTKGKSGRSSREKEKPKREGNRFILSLDVGTTGVRAIIFDDRAELVGSSYQPLVTLYPQPGWVEQDPEVRNFAKCCHFYSLQYLRRRCGNNRFLL